VADLAAVWGGGLPRPCQCLDLISLDGGLGWSSAFPEVFGVRWMPRAMSVHVSSGFSPLATALASLRRARNLANGAPFRSTARLMTGMSQHTPLMARHGASHLNAGYPPVPSGLSRKASRETASTLRTPAPTTNCSATSMGSERLGKMNATVIPVALVRKPTSKPPHRSLLSARSQHKRIGVGSIAG
jgi:hypothetical protein